MVTIEYSKAHVNLADQVYEPAEDSYLLADTALEFVKDGMDVLEIGTGSGFVSAVIKANRKVKLLATEISPLAAICARSNGIDVIRTDMFAGLKGKEQFDIIIFNPPYLPTSDDEKIPGWLNYAFDGGIDGRKDVVPFLQKAGNYLKSDGIILLLISSLTGVDEVVMEIEKARFRPEIVSSTKCSFERLVVIKGANID
ncbi:HemK2/MTQ2 family protein methyltransferase [Methanolobus bombayensis]|uniref:HemK2/MTQ2 family protein methyltransferase n=1 Tax=Methanolobus bombayensis TaxID=38023 RepID=UPI001AE9F24D|nr:HemK2/MTQ2 family protein methyltransferase [Methanolobus bombayensis]MBP1908724.1 release factor glutamine methyltransferase [Methanolobus bombayensis]